MQQSFPQVVVEVKRLEHGSDLPLPSYATSASAGMDLMAAIGDPITLEPMERLAIPTGIAIALSPGYEAQIRPRSGLALKQGLTVANAPGTIDADYRGEIKVILFNISDQPQKIQRAQRIAQMVIAPVCQARWNEVDHLCATPRGSGGFGHTGL